MEKKISLFTKQMKWSLILLLAVCLFFAGSMKVAAETGDVTLNSISIYTDDGDQTAKAGDEVTLSAQVYGDYGEGSVELNETTYSEFLTYTWTYVPDDETQQAVSLASGKGESGSQYTFTADETTFSGSYKVEVSYEGATRTISNNISFMEEASFYLNYQENQYGSLNDQITLSVTLEDSERTQLDADDFVFEWYKDGSVIEAATGSSYEFQIASQSDYANYSVLVHTKEKKDNAWAYFTVQDPDNVYHVTLTGKDGKENQDYATNAENYTLTASLTDCYDCSIDDISDYTFQWYYMDEDGNETKIENATNSTYEIAANSDNFFGTYRVSVYKMSKEVYEGGSFYLMDKIRNAAIKIYTENNACAVGDKVGIYTSLLDENWENSLDEETASLYDYQWYFSKNKSAFQEWPWNSDDIEKIDCTDSSYHIKSMTEDSFGTYCVQLLYKGEQIRWATITITNVNDYFYMNLSGNKAGDPGDEIDWKVGLTNYQGKTISADEFTFKWYKDGTLIEGATGSNYKFTIDDDSYGQYEVVAERNGYTKEEYINLISKKANISVNILKKEQGYAAFDQGDCVKAGEQYTLFATLKDAETYLLLKDTSDYKFVWYINDVKQDETGSTLTFTADESPELKIIVDVVDAETGTVYQSLWGQTFANYYSNQNLLIDEKIYKDKGTMTLNPLLAIYRAGAMDEGREGIYAYERDFSGYTFKWYKDGDDEALKVNTHEAPQFEYALEDENQYGAYHVDVYHTNSDQEEVKIYSQNFEICPKSDYAAFEIQGSKNKAKAGEEVTLTLIAKDIDGKTMDKIPSEYSFEWEKRVGENYEYAEYESISNESSVLNYTVDQDDTFAEEEGGYAIGFRCIVSKNGEEIDRVYQWITFDDDSDDASDANITFKSNLSDTDDNYISLYKNVGDAFNIAFEVYQNGEKIESLPEGYKVKWYEYVRSDDFDGEYEEISEANGLSYTYTYKGETVSQLRIRVYNKDDKEIYSYYIDLKDKKAIKDVTISGNATGNVGDQITWTAVAKDAEGESVDLSAYSLHWCNKYNDLIAIENATATYTFTVDENLIDVPKYCYLYDASGNNVDADVPSLNFRLLGDDYVNVKINEANDASEIYVNSTDQSFLLTASLYDADGNELDASKYDLQWENTGYQDYQPIKGATGETYELTNLDEIDGLGCRIAVYAKNNPNKLLATDEVVIFTKEEDTTCKHSGETEIKNKVEASCTTEGYTGDSYCKDCGALISKGEAIPATGHDVDFTTWVKDTANNIQYHVCKNCGKHFNECEISSAKDVMKAAETISDTSTAEEINDVVNKVAASNNEELVASGDNTEEVIAKFEKILTSNEESKINKADVDNKVSDIDNISVTGESITAAYIKNTSNKVADNDTVEAVLKITKANDTAAGGIAVDIALDVVNKSSDEVIAENVQPVAPIYVSMDIPESLKNTTFHIFHKHADGTYEEVTYTIDKDNNKLSFVITSLSEYIFTSKGHVIATKHNAVSATCTKDGSAEYYDCKYHSGEKLDKNANVIKGSTVIKATGHKTTVINKKSASYTAAGYTGDTICSVCKQTIQKGKSIAKLVLAVPTSLKVKAAKKSLTVSFKKAKAATGTQIQYSTKKSMKKAKTKLVSAKSAKIKKLVSKKKYYVRVRSYKKIGSKKVYSKWSAIKAVKVK